MNLGRALAQAAHASPHKAVHFVEDGAVQDRATLETLYLETGQVASFLRRAGVRRHDRVAIALPNSVGFARAFFGIIAAGAVAVPLPPPFRFASLEIHLSRIARALRQSKVPLIIADATMTKIIRPAFAGIDDQIHVVCIDDITESGRVFVDVDEDAPALIQYTSGTSGSPKGVVLTHANVLSNIEAIRCGLRLSGNDVACSWLPLFHDMGLIGHLLAPVVCQLDCYLLRPEEFLRRPLRWLAAVDRFGATIASAPSSAYAHCIRHVSDDDVEGLDLSQWRLALNGAESIDGRVLRDFAAKFGPAGFRRSSFLPVYGLAEASLAVTFPPTDREPRSIWVRRDGLGSGVVESGDPSDSTTRELISVGSPVLRAEYGLMDDDGLTAVCDGRVGEIVVRGPSVSAGYEGDDHVGATPVTPGEWVATGDLGVRVDDELYVVGRKKEMLIMLGQNYFACDIESIVGAAPGIPSRGVLATSVPTDSGEGGLLLFIETDELGESQRAAVEGTVRHAVSSSLGLTPQHIVFVPKGRIERTSSGKFRRHGIESLVEEYLAGVRVAISKRDVAKLAEQRGSVHASR